MRAIIAYGGVSVMSPTKTNDWLRSIRQEQRIGDRIAITHFVSPCVMETDNGDLMAVLQIEGHPFDTESNTRLNALQRCWQSCVEQCDERFVILGSLQRNTVSADALLAQADGLAGELDRLYHASYSQQPLYKNTLYLTVVRRGLSQHSRRGVLRWWRGLSSSFVMQQRQAIRQHHYQELLQQLEQMRVTLAPFAVTLLGEHDSEKGDSECLAFLSLFVNGMESQSYRFGEYSNAFAQLPSDRQMRKFPQQHIGRYIARKRLYFGKCIQLGEADSSDVRYAAMVSIKQYCAQTHAFVMDLLLRLPVCFIASHHFLTLDMRSSERLIQRKARKLAFAEQADAGDLDAMQQLRHSGRDGHSLGWHQHSMMVVADNQQQLDDDCRSVIDAMLQQGIVAIRESLGQQAAFWSQIPGHYRWLTRPSLISSANFCHLFPLHNYRQGYYDRNHLGQALCLMQTAGRTPFWLNCHLPGSRDSCSLGHAVLIGSSGSGKTVLLSFVLIMLMRYRGLICVIDRDQAMRLLVLALGGQYHVIGPHTDIDSQSLRMNPLQLPDTASNRSFCKQWLVSLAKDEPGSRIEAESQQQLHECVDYCFEQLAPKDRCLRHALELLPINFNYWPQMRRWLAGSEEATAGEYAHLFDHDEDNLVIDALLGFDFSYYLDAGQSLVVEIISMYLMHRLQQHMTGQLVSILIDEAWQILSSNTWQQRLTQWLATLRKHNAHVVLSTQSMQSVLQSPIAHTVLDNCATQWLMPNPQAKQAEYCDGFGLSDAEYLAVKNAAIEDRLFLHKQGSRSALLRLELTSLQRYMPVLSANARVLQQWQDMRQQHGDDFAVWLQLFLRRCQQCD